MNEYILQTDEEYDGTRLDKALSEMLEPAVSRSYIRRLIDNGEVFVNGKATKASYTLKENDTIRLTMPDVSECEIAPEDIPLDILYEDDDVIVVNKPKGMVVHPAAGHMSGTLVNALLYHCKGTLSGINGILRPGIVHRIDKDTSGSVIACKNDAAHTAIAMQLKEHSLNRTYRAIALGNLTALTKENAGAKGRIITFDENGFLIDAAIGRHPNDRKRMSIESPSGKSAQTHVSILEQLRDCTYIECRLRTGRTHQIRVHMEAIGYPLLGDDVYNRGRSVPVNLKRYDTAGQTLHAYRLGFIHPRSGEYIETVAPIPSYMEKIINDNTILKTV